MKTIKCLDLVNCPWLRVKVVLAGVFQEDFSEEMISELGWEGAYPAKIGRQRNSRYRGQRREGVL